MARSSEMKFLLVSVPLLLLAVIIVLAQPALAPGVLEKRLLAVGADPLPLDQIKLPPGFAIDVYATGVSGARQMALGANGTLFVGSIEAGNVYAVVDDDRDGHADEVLTIAKGLHMPNGVAFRDGSLYVMEVSRLLRYDDIELHLRDPPQPVVVNDSYPTSEWHGWKYIRFGPDGQLYVPIGAPCNVCDPPLPYASITRLNADGTGFAIFARGIRNTVGFDWDPQTGELWFTDNGRDYLGDDLPPDELNHAPRAGLNFGFPYVHGKSVIDPEFGQGHNASEFTLPEIELDAHVAALGMKFYTGSTFPQQYRDNIFIAEHGSWNRNVPIGYRIEVVTLDANRTAVEHHVFAE
ncbi:MAG TPA: PQQ-dependent sugar dehydrogenase, partial [Methanocella sp.]|nr:PQQ-dependent sugar dehydrogenase [Methanocella sp.]